MSNAHALLGYHASGRGDRALRAAAGLADRRGAHLTVLAAVIDTEQGRRCCGIQGEQWLALLRESAAEALDRARQQLGTRLNTSFVVGEGDSLDDVLGAYAREARCDLAVVPASALRGVMRQDLREVKLAA